MLAYYHTLREKDGLTHEDAIRDSIVSVLMSPEFLLPHRSADARFRSARSVRRAQRPLPHGALLRVTPLSATRWPAG